MPLVSAAERARKRVNAPARVMGPDSVAARTAEIVKLRRAGWTWPRIADRMALSLRTVYDYGRRAREQTVDPDTEAFDPGPPKTKSQLAPEVLARLEDTPEGFRAFFDHYSGLRMAQHTFSFVQACFEYPKGGPVVRSQEKAAEEADDAGDPLGATDDRETDPALRTTDSPDRSPPSPSATRRRGRWKLRVVLNVPPNHAKSTVFTVWMRIWRICQDRGFKSIIVSETADMAVQFASEIAEELDQNRKLLEDFGRFRSDTHWQPGKGAIRVDGSGIKRGYNILARGRGTQIQSLRADEIVVDDPEGTEDVLTPERQDATERWMNKVVKSRLGPGGRTVLIQTRMAMQDLSGRLTSRKTPDGDPVWQHINFKAITDYEAKLVLWDCEQQGGQHGQNGVEYPDCCRPFDYLVHEVLEDIGSFDFNQTYQQQPLPEGATLVEYRWIIGADLDPDPNKGCLDRHRSWGPRPLPEGMQRILSFDPSGGRGYSALVMADVGLDKDTFRADILEIWRAKQREGGGIVRIFDQLDRMAEMYHPWGFIYEKAVFRGIDELQLFEKWCKKNGIRPLEQETTATKNAPDYGIQTMSADFEFGRIRMPYGDIQSKMQSEILIKEATEYVVGAHLGASDDVLHALWFIKNNLARIVRRGLYSVAQIATHWTPPLAYGKGWKVAR